MAFFFYALKQYSMLALMCVAFWGAGHGAVRLLTRDKMEDGWLGGCLSLTVGLGLFILCLQGLAATGLLSRGCLYVVLMMGWCCALWALRGMGPEVRAWWLRRSSPWGWLVIGLVVATLIRPLSISLPGDDTMYHLPHAREWANAGRLTVNEWLRYPWFPYNYDLLYAAALILRNDVFAHLLHALAGWLTTLMIYRLGFRYGNHLLALLACGLWMHVSIGFLGTAYIDLGIALLVLAACVAFHQWLLYRYDEGWLLVASFLLGVATGAKYQILIFSPLFLTCAVLNRASVKLLLKAAVIFLVPCVYWYARNYMVTGDPFNPLGGKLFGYSDWNQGDMAYQLFDLNNMRNWPDMALWPALLSPIFLFFKRSRSVWCAVVFAAYATLVWAVTSHYDRYLMPVYPVLALLSAYTVSSLLGWVVRCIPDNLIRHTIFLKYPMFLTLAICLGWWGHKEYKAHRPLVALNAVDREDIRHRMIPEYSVLEYLRNNPQGRIYQWGLEARIYYFSTPVRGDHFGRWRYRDFTSYTPEIMSAKLKQGGFDVLVTNRIIGDNLEITWNFKEYFQEIVASPGAKAYKIIKW